MQHQNHKKKNQSEMSEFYRSVKNASTPGTSKQEGKGKLKNKKNVLWEPYK